MSKKIKTKTFWIAWSNTDLTEGRGYAYPLAISESRVLFVSPYGVQSLQYAYPLAISESRACAIRMGRKGGVMGSDCHVEPFESPFVNGQYLFPAHIYFPEKEDDAGDKKYESRQKAIETAKAAGLDEATIKALMQ
jgi:hypothetical protein